MVSVMVSFCVCPFFQRDVIDEILDLIWSLSEGFLTYSCSFCESSCYFCESSCLFYLIFNSDFYVTKIMHL